MSASVVHRGEIRETTVIANGQAINIEISKHLIPDI